MGPLSRFFVIVGVVALIPMFLCLIIMMFLAEIGGAATGFLGSAALSFIAFTLAIIAALLGK